MDSPNHYELLCVTPEATADEIRTAYRRLIRVFHPDVATEAGQVMTQRLNDAQRELLDPTLRASYDSKLRMYAGSPTMSYQSATKRGYSQPRYSSAGFTPGGASSGPATESSAPWPGAPKVAPLTFSASRYYVLMAAMIAASAAILFTTVIIFAVCYAGSITLLTPRIVPPVIVGIAWLVAALRKPAKLLIALMVIGAGLWPLAAAGVAPFTLLNEISTVLPCMTVLAVAVVVFRTVMPLASEQSRVRPIAHRRARPFAA